VPDRSIVRGVPGKVLAEILGRHAEMIRYAADEYVKRVARYKVAGNL
jgi:carbonic anhydrase/acetyltransferase-like protein (isoleucine patch superfamily)